MPLISQTTTTYTYTCNSCDKSSTYTTTENARVAAHEARKSGWVFAQRRDVVSRETLRHNPDGDGTTVLCADCDKKLVALLFGEDDE